ncbi:pyridine nucleotide-disulfide oxidoreductase [Coraliomargarita sinensis]|uniref:Pyridine nucleotide-disulfide oxidoreductase n=1 Tax=Coraliomargarita sinensis TaxID=2174842 RepID=A0A317ZL41_9BACT|nr:NAD(P)/FAD-dependent oxidoreductase [Coraliomargarita sinensis]PXA04549.1 pyridine nucleotide-disulfide oxidoreductase [Coraliomargarita sinensis]
MKKEHFDYIVIGGGSGGYAAARTAREVFDRVAIVDGAQELGGLCILKGCMPSKTLIYSTEVLHLAQQGRKFGLNIPEAKADMPVLHERKIATIDEFAEYRQEQLESDRFSLYKSQAKFVDPRTISLADGTELTADYFMIATGSVVSCPPVQGLSEVPYWTSDDVLDLNFLPEKVIVLGGGVVACELAQFLRRAGSEVIQIQRSPHILKESSPDAASVIEEQFRKEGIELYTDTQIDNVAYEEGVFWVKFKNKGSPTSAEAPYLLNALGRKPAIEGLNLEAANVEVMKSGHISCNPNQQTTNERIYACGDVAGPHEIVHVAILQGELAARHATGRAAEPVNYDTLLGVTFTDPQIGQVGLSEAQLKERGIDYISADFPFDDHGKSILMEAKTGYVKVMAERSSGQILGAECVGKDGGELVHAMAVAITLKATAADLLKVHWYHPTLSEIWTYPLEDIVDEMNQT